MRVDIYLGSGIKVTLNKVNIKLLREWDPSTRPDDYERPITTCFWRLNGLYLMFGGVFVDGWQKGGKLIFTAEYFVSKD